MGSLFWAYSYRKSGNGQSKVTAASAGPGVSAGNHVAESSRGMEF